MRDDESFETDLQEMVADLEGEVFGETDEMAMEASELDGEGELDEILAGEVRTPAARGGANVRVAIERQRRRSAGFARAVRGLAPYVRRRDSRVVLAIPARSAGQVAARLGIKTRGVEILARSAALWRPQRGQPPSRELDMETGAAGSCPGRSDVTFHWWGIKVWLNKCQTDALTNGITAGAAAAGICAKAAPHAYAKAACGALLLVLPLGASVIKGIDSLGGGNGITIRKFPDPITPPIVWHQ